MSKSLFDGTLKIPENHRQKNIELLASATKKVSDKKYDRNIDPIRLYFGREKVVNPYKFSEAIHFLAENPKLKIDKKFYENLRKSKSENVQEMIYVILLSKLRGSVVFPDA